MPGEQDSGQRDWRALRALVVDRSYLIAMDLQSMLVDGFGCRADVTTPRDMLEAAISHACDIVFLEESESAQQTRLDIAALENSGARVVLTTTQTTSAGRSPDFPNHPALAKPFETKALACAIEGAMA